MSASAKARTAERDKQIQEKFQRMLNDLLQRDENKFCADCDSKGKYPSFLFIPFIYYHTHTVFYVRQDRDGVRGTWEYSSASGARGCIATSACISLVSSLSTSTPGLQSSSPYALSLSSTCFLFMFTNRPHLLSPHGFIIWRQ